MTLADWLVTLALTAGLFGGVMLAGRWSSGRWWWQ